MFKLWLLEVEQIDINPILLEYDENRFKILSAKVKRACNNFWPNNPEKRKKCVDKAIKTLKKQI
jgi:hypothetical protein